MADDSREFSDPLENYEPPAFGDRLEAALAEETAAAIQSSPVSAISPETTISEAVKHLHDHEIACLLVIEAEKLVGVFSVRDVLDKVAENYDAMQDRPVNEVMTSNPAFAYESDASGAVLCLMAASGYRHVPVLDSHDKAIGIVSPQRIMNFLLAHLTAE